ncbi:MAG: hypothetical protein WA667_01635, partial [Candidatus Nitrosopolaris sp.]
MLYQTTFLTTHCCLKVRQSLTFSSSNPKAKTLLKICITHVTRLNCTTKIPLDMESTKMQLELKPDTITIKVNMWQGVL